MRQDEKMTALESLIYTFARSQFQKNGITPGEARIVMECVNSKFRWHYIDACMLSGIMAEGGETDSQIGPSKSDTKETVNNHNHPENRSEHHPVNSSGNYRPEPEKEKQGGHDADNNQKT